IPCAEIDTAAAFRLMINATARELAMDRAKCLYREWSLLQRVEVLHVQTSEAHADQRKRCDHTIAMLETRLHQEHLRNGKLKPWATVGKVSVGVVSVALLGAVAVQIIGAAQP